MSDASMPARASPSGDLAPWRSPLSVSTDDRPPMRTVDVPPRAGSPRATAPTTSSPGPGSLIESCRLHPTHFGARIRPRRSDIDRSIGLDRAAARAGGGVRAGDWPAAREEPPLRRASPGLPRRVGRCQRGAVEHVALRHRRGLLRREPRGPGLRRLAHRQVHRARAGPAAPVRRARARVGAAAGGGGVVSGRVADCLAAAHRREAHRPQPACALGGVARAVAGRPA